MAIQVLGSLCVGVAHQSNKATQKEIANTDALSFLVNQLKRNMNPLIQVNSIRISPLSGLHWLFRSLLKLFMHVFFGGC